MLTKMEVLSYIRDLNPTCKEMADYFGESPGHVDYWLKLLMKEGLIEREGVAGRLKAGSGYRYWPTKTGFDYLGEAEKETMEILEESGGDDPVEVKEAVSEKAKKSKTGDYLLGSLLLAGGISFLIWNQPGLKARLAEFFQRGSPGGGSSPEPEQVLTDEEKARRLAEEIYPDGKVV